MTYLPDELESSAPPGDRLRRALDAFLEAADAPEEDRARVLAAHGDLEDLLEPMLEGAGADPPPALAAITDDPAGHAFAAALLGRLAEAGPRIERYRRFGEIARGGMGVVSEVHDVELGRRVAMKRIRERREDDGGERAELDPGLLRRFLNEARILGQLDHPGIVPIHELGVDERGRPYFTMPLIEGHDLETVLKLTSEGREGYTVGRVLTLMIKVCETLAYAHSRGVVHRDLKPANIRVGRYGEVYVMDWGLAKLTGEGDVHDLRFAHALAADPVLGANSPLTTVDGTIVGTPAYMAPEQARGDVDQVTHLSDVYSLGAILYQVLAEHPPYDDDPSRPLDARTLLTRVRHEPPRPIHDHDPRVPRELVAICQQAMARRPLRRYASAAAMAEDLRAFCEDRVVFAHRTGPWAEVRKWIARNRVAALLGVLLVVGALFSWRLVASLHADWDAEVETLRERQRAANVAHALELRAADREAQRLAQERDDARTEHGRAELRTQRERSLAEAERSRRLAEIAALEERHAEFVAEQQRAAQRVRTLERDGRERERWSFEIARRLQTLQGELADASRAQLESERSVQRSRELVEHLVGEWIGELRTRADRELWPLLDLQGTRTAAWLDAARRLAALRPALVAACPDLAAELAAFFDAQDGALDDGRRAHAPTHPGVVARLALLRALRYDTLESAEAQRAWDDALATAGRSPRYADTVLEPLPGFLPLGLDPATGLLELWFVPSGERPLRATGPEPGPWCPTATSGAVFVWVPAATFHMGASPSPSLRSRNRDHNARPDEGPVQEVSLAPYLLMKHELTRGQWERLGGALGPDGPRTPEPDGALPVTNVAFEDAVRILARHALDVPTEAQWEFAARGRTERAQPYWTGWDEGKLRAAEHLRDLRRPGDPDRPLPVGTLGANGLGFHDVLGNVSEWCRSGWPVREAAQAGNTLATLLGGSNDEPVVRGGSFRTDALDARVTRRRSVVVGERREDLGLRAARSW